MNTTLLHAILAGAALLASTAAQAVTASLAALTPLTVTVTDGSQVYFAGHPSGPLAQSGSLYTQLPLVPNSAASLQWSAYASENEVVARLSILLANYTQLPSYQGRVGPLSVLIAFDPTTSFVGNLEVRAIGALTPGASWPQIDVDLDNDGILDVNGLVAGVPATRHGLVLAGVPWLLRLSLDASLGNALGSDTQVEIVLRPDNNLTLGAAVTECFPFAPPPPPFAQASFADSGVDFLVPAAWDEFPLLVLGFAAQPTFLSMPGQLPCILLPSPEVVLFTPTGRWHQPLPANVRPVTFYAQGAMIGPSGLRTSTGYAIQAN